MEDLTETSTLAEIMAERPGVERVLERFGLDYCCGGSEPLADAAGARGIDPRDVLAAIAASEPEPIPAWRSMGPAELVDHIERTHHGYLHIEMPRLSALVAKVASVHGDRHPELDGIERLFAAIRADLEPHLAKEEQVLLPMIRQLAAADAAPEFHCGSIQRPISVMLAEHDTTGALIDQLKDMTGAYAAPADGCASYRALYEAFAALDADTRLHIHKENYALFPAVVEREAAVASPAS